MINRLEAGLRRRFGDAIGIAIAGVAAVDEDRLARRRDDKRRRPALGVDEVDVEPPFLSRAEDGRKGEQDRQ